MALGAQQLVEWPNHLSQVDEMYARLRRESFENRDGMNFDQASLRKSLNAVDNQISLLNGCKTPSGLTSFAPVKRPLVLLVTDSAWLGVRDSALLIGGYNAYLDVVRILWPKSIKQSQNA
ncbi:hypothetical protein ABDK56_11080 [Sphingomonas sp. ASV193]|uniref:hypothetical protein n=1 Tax=Sphingomonas sp. ASV193 TaxID=3144405 RepID=UPI0032E8FC20